MPRVSTLPQFQTDDKDVGLLQNTWAALLNVMLGNPSLQCNILSKVVLTTGDNKINHLLGRKLIGWRIVRQRASATIYDKQDSNQSPNLTLVLNSSANVTVDLEVF